MTDWNDAGVDGDRPQRDADFFTRLAIEQGRRRAGQLPPEAKLKLVLSQSEKTSSPLTGGFDWAHHTELVEVERTEVRVPDLFHHPSPFPSPARGEGN